MEEEIRNYKITISDLAETEIDEILFYYLEISTNHKDKFNSNQFHLAKYGQLGHPPSTQKMGLGSSRPILYSNLLLCLIAKKRSSELGSIYSGKGNI